MPGPSRIAWSLKLRLDRVSTLAGANYLLRQFLERFNRQFAVAPAQPQTAYRPLDPEIDLEMVLCFRHFRRVGRDNTVRYRWQVIQLLPSEERPSYAGVRVEVFEHTDGRLQVAFADGIVPSQLVPPRPGLLRINRADSDPDRLQRQLAKVQQLPETTPPKKRLRRRRAAGRKPTARQVARWQAVQTAKTQGNEHQRHGPRAWTVAENSPQVHAGDRAAAEPVKPHGRHQPATIMRTR